MALRIFPMTELSSSFRIVNLSHGATTHVESQRSQVIMSLRPKVSPPPATVHLLRCHHEWKSRQVKSRSLLSSGSRADTSLSRVYLHQTEFIFKDAQKRAMASAILFSASLPSDPGKWWMIFGKQMNNHGNDIQSL